MSSGGYSFENIQKKKQKHKTYYFVKIYRVYKSFYLIYGIYKPTEVKNPIKNRVRKPKKNNIIVEARNIIWVRAGVEVGDKSRHHRPTGRLKTCSILYNY